MEHRAYSILDIKSMHEDADELVIEGIASTPTPDRMGDVVEPKGAKFRLPMPLLWQHQHDKPVGKVNFAAPTSTGIPFRAAIPKIAEAGTLKDRVDEARHSIKAGLITAVSIGFRAISGAVEQLKTGGLRFKEWEWLELSLVTIPANSEATIQTVKALDTKLLAASGRAQPVERKRAGVSAVVTLNSGREANAMNVQDQIRSFEAKRAALVAQRDSVMEKAHAEGRTLDETESEQFDTVASEVKAVDQHLTRLRQCETEVAPRAVAIAGGTPAQALEARAGAVITAGKSNMPKGTAFTRYAMALANGRGSLADAMVFAKRWKDTTPEVIAALQHKADPGTTTDATWAAPLVDQAQIASEFIELLRPATILGRMTGVRRVPFNIKMPVQTSGSTVAWVGEKNPKPVGELAFDTHTLEYTKVAGIIVISEELARLSSPAAEDVVRRDLVAQVAQYLDVQLLTPTVAAVAGVNPASLTNSVTGTAITASGKEAADLRCDLRDLFALLIGNNLSVSGSVLVMSEVMATGIGMMVNAFGQPEFPGLGAMGGTLAGVPVITSENTPDGLVVLIKQSEILLADDGGVTLDTSREATLNMADTNPATAASFNLWQRNCVGIRAERWVNWKARRAAAVAYITGADYGNCNT
jgi:HK97 family phage major capsid protein/HK97 family phage prohead protease